MCGRFVQTQEAENYGAYFSVDVVQTEEILRSWNVAPTKQVYAVAEHDGERMLGTFGWGLVPFWAKDRKIGARLINARVETAGVKPAFRDSFAARRCIVPADGFYEWEPKDRGKLPHYFYATDRSPLALAGLWASWKDPESGDRVRTCTIVTGETIRCGLADPRSDAGDSSEDGLGRLARPRQPRQGGDQRSRGHVADTGPLGTCRVDSRQPCCQRHPRPDHPPRIGRCLAVAGSGRIDQSVERHPLSLNQRTFARFLRWRLARPGSFGLRAEEGTFAT